MHPESYGPSVNSRGQQGSLTQLADGRWRARYRENGRSGRRPQRTFDRKTDAADWLRDQIERGPAGDLGSGTVTSRTVEAALDAFLDAHDVDEVTTRKLRSQLTHARAMFADRPLGSLEPYELQAWRKNLPTASVRHYAFKAFDQALTQATAWGWLTTNPADGIKNPRPRRREVVCPPWQNIVTVSGEIDVRYEALPVFAAGTGLRPEEWIALERRHVDYEERVVHVRAVHSQGRLVELGAEGSKSWRQRRRVPLRRHVVDALQRMPRRIDSPLLFPAPQGGYLDLERFRTRFWVPAFRAAGLDPFPVKDCRHVYASEAIAAGYDLFTLSRRMGTSLKEIDDTYGHLVDDSDERELALLDAYDQQRAVAK